MTIIQMEILLKVVETGNFTKAGEELGLSQSAVSHAISNLESELGFALIRRNRTGVSMTPNGKEIIAYMRTMLNILEQMKQKAADIQGMQTGTIRVGSFPSVSIKWMPFILKKFHHEYPSIQVEIREGGYEQIEEWISGGFVDLGFLPFTTKKLPFDMSLLQKDRLVLLLPVHHALSQIKIPNLEQIAKEPFIMPKKGCDVQIRKMFKEKKLKPNVLLEIGDDHAIVAMVQAGLGVSILPEMTLPNAIENIHATYIGEETYRTIGIAASTFATLSPAAQKFLDLTETWIKGQAQ
ncbi:LysR family transcriptional regulator [Shimazuella alba]|uniref:LysR family transcriptional regulator n=1 Tax=Shimazuella alba TaxID=2690964 RepID=A0A6I4VW44_9BACL|nr:LysR family transcriptional regulator [Shimazuella alba]MXQ54056.1 LysR family transcriptional regulator [Shimazuella alba]